MNKFCPLPFCSVEATPMGKARACCISTEDIPNIDLRNNTLQEAFDSKYMDKLRFSMLLGAMPDNCSRCWDEEAAGRTSKRMHSIQKLKSLGIKSELAQPSGETKLSFLDLKLGNICNLKCRICGSFSSSKWAAEELAIHPKNETARANLKAGNWPRESDAFWTNLKELLPSIKYFEFTGGEPFLIEEHFDLLAIAVMMGVAGNISIHYNTNTTTIPKLGLQLWPHFKEVEIAVSVDDMYDRFEYQRYGAKWQDTVEHLRMLRELRDVSKNIKLQLCLTVNALNIYYLDDICRWIPDQKFDFVYFNMLHSADHFNIKNLNDRAKIAVNEKFQKYTGPYMEDIYSILNFMNQGDEDADVGRLISVLQQSDQQRKQHYKDAHPDMSRFIGYE